MGFVASDKNGGHCDYHYLLKVQHVRILVENTEKVTKIINGMLKKCWR